MNPNEVIEAYFAAWDAHDGQAVIDLYAEDGTYQDPATESPLSGQAIGDYAEALFAAFPDLKLELISQADTSIGQVAVPWLLFGTHQGPLGEMEATGKSVAIRGCDYIVVEDGKLKTVYGTFSLQELMEQLS